MGFGLGLKFSRPQSAQKGSEDDEQWYIPYNGPYEPPRGSTSRARPRDSWGDLIDGAEEGLDAMLGDEELRRRFGGGHSGYYNTDNSKSPIDGMEKRLRGRATSFASGRTVSSGAVDPNRGSVLAQRRSTVSSNQRPPVPSHIEASGGVGESPVPHLSGKESVHSNRLSLGTIFSFKSSSRKSFSAPPGEKDVSRSSLRKVRPPKLKTVDKEETKVLLPGPTSSSSSDSHDSSHKKSVVASQDVTDSTKIGDDDYYNSYYSTLAKGPEPQVSPQNPAFAVNPRAAPRPSSGSTTVSRQETFSSHSIHPYAYIFPKQQDPDPSESRNHDVSHPLRDAPRLAFASPAASNQSTPPPPQTNGLGLKQLKNSSSTPNLRSPNKYTPPRGIERWLSAETWCDAILFPRPRLKIKEERSPRIISPPGSPLDADQSSKNSTAAVTSRVLAHSQSLVNLSASKKQAVQEPLLAPPARAGEKAPRPKSFALDDLALIKPVLSLERVLEEGQELEKQRKEWQLKASSSIGNARARTLSRTRSKSLTQKGRANGHRNQTSFDYLAARACLGSQNLSPAIAQATSRNTFFTDPTTATSSAGRVSHSHSNSLAKSWSKSSNSHSRGHSHSGSWDKSGSKHGNGKANQVVDGRLHEALKRDESRFPRTQDQNQTLLPVSDPNLNPDIMLRVSPTPSAGSNNVQMGIAISTTTPPLIETPLDREIIRMPAHPYAQPSVAYLGEQQQFKRQAAAAQESPAPKPFLASHPYALALEPDSPAFTTIGPIDGNVTPQSKMWAQVAPGVVREVLPSDINNYSPFVQNQGASLPPSEDADADLVGVGEALGYSSFRNSRDSGLGTSEGHVIQPYVPSSSSPLGMHEYTAEQPPPPPPPQQQSYPHRKPVQYDASRPIYSQSHYRKASADISLAESTASSSRRVIANNSNNHNSPNNHNNQNPDRLHIQTLEPMREHSPAQTTSGTPSPRLSPRSLGSPNDLDSFHDLFYRPQRRTGEPHPYRSSPSADSMGEIALRSRRTGSGLTSLARELSQEFEQLERERERTSGSQASTSISSSSGKLGRRTLGGEGSLQFVFEEMPRSASPMAEEGEDQDTTVVFKPSFLIPEDVHSRSSSSLADRTAEHDEDETAMFRVGVVESVSTPPAEVSDRRRSFTGLMSEVPPPSGPQSPNTDGSAHLSVLISPVTDHTRSSYMTTSTTSRMSGLSDFPAPPRDAPLPILGHQHLSFLASAAVREESTLNHHQLQALRESPHPMHPHERRFTFGVDQDAADVADELSNQDH
ncbi:hypothetical protein H1R20_g8844, partial [Candolleomyces eurysporus]